MASFNSMLFLTLLGAISALMAAPSVVEAQLVNNVINITGTVSTGTVPCALNTTLFPNGTGNPFRNARVQLRCGTSNTTVANTTADANGTFSILIDPPGGLLTALIIYSRTSRICTAVVNVTTLTTCNSTVPATGTLVSSLTRGPIQRVGTTRTLFLLANRFIKQLI